MLSPAREQRHGRTGEDHSSRIKRFPINNKHEQTTP
jgi:hypothetical protein